MASRERIPPLALVSILLVAYLAVPAFGETARFREGDLITGAVERVDGDLLTVSGKVYDTKNVRIQFIQGMSPLGKADLRGTRVEILVRNGKIHSVLVFPMTER